MIMTVTICDCGNSERGKKYDLSKRKDNRKGGMTIGSKKYRTMRVEKGQAIAFTNDRPHAVRENRTNKAVYRLFDYIVSNKSDFPLGKVFMQ